jgi:hypothetical protein
MKTTCTMDIKNNSIFLEGGFEPKRLIVDFFVAGKEGELVDFSEVSFGYQLQKIGEKIEESSWPLSGTRFQGVAPGLLTSADVKLDPNCDYRLLAWYSQKQYRAAVVKFFNSEKSLVLESSPKTHV